MLGHESTTAELVVPDQLVVKFASIVHEIFKHSADIAAIPPKLAEALNLKAWQAFEKSVSETLAIGKCGTRGFWFQGCPEQINSPENFWFSGYEIIDIGLKSRPTSGLLLDFVNAGLSEADIKRLFCDLIMAAGDTTSFATNWTLYQLAKNVGPQQELREQLKDTDDQTTQAVQNAVKETLRLYPVAHFIGRKFEVDGVMGMYKIPKDVSFLVLAV